MFLCMPLSCDCKFVSYIICYNEKIEVEVNKVSIYLLTKHFKWYCLEKY
jgi:hypothetical protein